MSEPNNHQVNEQSKIKDMEPFRQEVGEYMTTNQGVGISDTDNSLKAGERGPSLLEDFHHLEKMSHFDRERIPERVVHARGAGAHGYFQVYESMANYTKAKFLQDPSVKTPVFVRFSNVGGSRGSADTVRDVRGFSIKFYTEEGNYDFVGNNIPVFFIQDGIKFPDIIHAVKPEPNNEIPQASSAHDNFWDFISLVPESMHMIMWFLSDRTLAKSYRMIQGFGVHTFRFVNEQGKARFVKFHWKPLLGVHSFVWDEAQKLSGKDPDYHRRDLWEMIEMGHYPEYELGVQIIEEEDELKFGFDILDSTKFIPEELVPVIPVGKMVLNRNPDNYFAETEQSAFHPGRVVPGIDFSDDPLLQSRIFSYHDTQLYRLGANFAHLPINRPVCPVHNNQQDGFMQTNIKQGRTNYYPNSLGGGCPMMTPEGMSAFSHYSEQLEGNKVRKRSETFKDHFSQATLFWNSLTDIEKEHLVKAAHFELGKVQTLAIRERMVELFNQVDHELAKLVAKGIGVAAPTKAATENHGKSSPAVSMEKMKEKMEKSAKTRQVAILAADGVNSSQIMEMKELLKQAGVLPQIVSEFKGTIKSADGQEIEVNQTFLTAASVMFDAVYVPGGKQSVEMLVNKDDAIEFVHEAFKHCKPIAAVGEGVELLKQAHLKGVNFDKAGSNGKVHTDNGIVTSQNGSDMHSIGQKFIEAIAQGRFWSREQMEKKMVGV
ncbi:catalase [Chroococcus sp. FPU101]|uniref:catalase n=1 Tax=Chroococcus sp. FPU101 TaxID=1974212 RepID=UPI001A8DDA6E|nr:catalase [Chroococcus sp. FPU101]GFE68018.1 catalase [Chroococcus sp. FPU101]